MPLDESRLMEFLEVVDAGLRRRIVLVAVGGTAMTLLDLKPSTLDVDFTAPAEDADAFTETLRTLPHGFKVDCWKDGAVFSQFLPSDYLERSLPIRHLRHIDLRALHPVDIVVTKIGRLDERDIQDITACIRTFRLTKDVILERARQVTYVGREANYKANLRHVIGRFFREEKRRAG
ncbi:MAG: DUF6036 family nucleotidyltransferase [Thermoplasmata archaeon]